MSLARYIKYKHVKELNAHILSEYDHVARLVDVPNNLSDRTYMTSEYHQVLNFGNGDANAPKILIDAGHHSRELTSIQMVCYTMLRLLFEYEQEMVSDIDNQKMIVNLLRDNNILFLPVVNIDGFYKICNVYE